MNARLLVLLSSACLEPTEIVLEISTDVDCSEVASTSILFDAATTPIALTTECNAGRIGNFVLVPSGAGSTGTVIVQMALHNGSACTDAVSRSCITATRIVGFVAHEHVILPIALEAACIDISCGAGATCIHGTCQADQMMGSP